MEKDSCVSMGGQGIKSKAWGMMGNACHTSTWERLSQGDCKFKASIANLTQTMSQK